MPQAREPAQTKPSTAKHLKNQHRKHGKGQSLKSFARGYAPVQDLSENWLFNKKANFSIPPLGIGNTGKKRGGKKKDDAVAPKKR